MAELTALLNKGATVKVDRTPARNEPCSCGSGKKYKKSCGWLGHPHLIVELGTLCCHFRHRR
jgi:hypothetical protein